MVEGMTPECRETKMGTPKQGTLQEYSRKMVKTYKGPSRYIRFTFLLYSLGYIPLVPALASSCKSLYIAFGSWGIGGLA